MVENEDLEPMTPKFWGERPKRFTPSQLQIIGARDPIITVPGAPQVGVGVGILKMISSTGYQAILTVPKPLPFDVAIFRINQIVRKLGFESVKDQLIYNLLCRTLDDPLPVEVHARSILFVFNNLHKSTKLKLNFEKLMENWGKGFNAELEKTKDIRKLPDGNHKEPKLLVHGSAHALALQQTRLFGGVSYRFTEKDVLKILRKHAGGRNEIDKDEYCRAIRQSVHKIVSIEERIMSPIMAPIIFRRPLFPKGDIRELKL